MHTIPTISSPFSEPWTAWVLLLILVLGILVNVTQPGVIWNSFRTLLSKPERSYADTQSNVTGQMILRLFRLLTVSMAYYLVLYRTGTFSLLHYGLIIALVGGVDIVRWLLILMIDYTFRLQKKCATITMHYSAIQTAACCALYPFMLWIMYYGINAFLTKGVLVLIGITLALILYKFMRAYLRNAVSLFYIIIYVMTLEVLPLVAIYAGVQHIISPSFIL